MSASPIESTDSSEKVKKETNKAKKVTFDKAAIERKNGKRKKWKPTRRRQTANPIRDVAIVLGFFLFIFLLSYFARNIVEPSGNASGNKGSFGKWKGRHRGRLAKNQQQQQPPSSTSTQQEDKIQQTSELNELKKLMEQQHVQLEHQRQIIEAQKLHIERLTASDGNDSAEEAAASEVCRE